MKVLAILCTTLLALFSIQASAATATTIDDEFDPKASEWAEGVITHVDKDGKFQVSGMKSAYASNFADYHRQYFSFTETERELQRKQLQERYQGSLHYKASAEKPLAFSFSVPDPNVVVFDETSTYGTKMALWSYPEKAALLKYSDLKPGDRVVVGYDSSEMVRSILRVNPVISMSGESDQLIKPQVSDLVDKNGVHIMNKSSNETNPIPPFRPNRPSATASGSAGTDNRNYNDYPAVIGPNYVKSPGAPPPPVIPTPNLNDARTNPPNSRSPNAPSTAESNQFNSKDPVVPTNPNPPINSTSGAPLGARNPEGQTNPNQFNRPENGPSALTGPADNAPIAPNTPQPTPTTPGPVAPNASSNGQPNNATTPRTVPQRGTSR